MPIRKKGIQAVGSALVWLALSLPFAPLGAEPAAVRTKAERDALTPAQVLQSFRDGNERFLSGKLRNRDLLSEQRDTAAGQYPSAIVLSCIDSRVPAEFVFDKGIGEVFNGRVAGSVINPDLVGSAEYCCAIVGAKLVLVLGHSRCGAIRGAIDKVEMGSLTGVLDRVQPAIEAVGTSVAGPQKGTNDRLVEAVTRKNVELGVTLIRQTSPILREMEEAGKIKIVGANYDVESGRVEFIEVP